jgi:hypothetical protein
MALNANELKHWNLRMTAGTAVALPLAVPIDVMIGVTKGDQPNDP